MAGTVPPAAEKRLDEACAALLESLLPEVPLESRCADDPEVIRLQAAHSHPGSGEAI